MNDALSRVTPSNDPPVRSRHPSATGRDSEMMMVGSEPKFGLKAEIGTRVVVLRFRGHQTSYVELRTGSRAVVKRLNRQSRAYYDVD